MQSIRVRKIFSLFVPLAFPANFHVAQFKAPLGFTVTNKKTLAYYQYRVQLYYFNKEKNEEQEAENCFAFGKRNPLSIHYNSVHGGIEGVTLNIKINHYVFDFRRLKERIIRLTVACFDSTQTILQRGYSSNLNLLPKIAKDVENDENNNKVSVVIAWPENEKLHAIIFPTHDGQLSSEESSNNEAVHYSSDSHVEHPCGSNESSELIDYQENIVNASPDYLIVPQYNERQDEHYMVLYNGNAEVVGNFRALNFYKASDMNIKEDIRLLADGTKHSHEAMTDLIIDFNDVIIDFDCRDVLLRIDGVDYKFKPGIHDNVNRRFVGYIAQQVESVVPSAVQLIDGILHVDYESLIPYLSESIRQNFNDIKNIKADNEKLRHALDSIYDAFVDKKSRDYQGSTIAPFTEPKQPKLIPLAWRLAIILIAVTTMAMAVSAVVYFTSRDRATNPIGGKSDEQAALESLYYATSGLYWTNSNNWLSDRPICEWYGVVCQGSSVYGLLLAQNNMTGTIPSNINLLRSLQQLDLQENFISGTVPDSFTTMTELESIELSSNLLLGGTIPQDIGFLTKLVYFGASRNTFEGTVPKSISALTNLKQLILRANSLHGPALETIVGLSNITLIDLSNNKFTGTIPDSIDTLKNLQEFNLASNFFEGTIPHSIGSLKNLNAIYFDFNLFNGEIPESIFRLPELKELVLNGNAFKSTIPANIGDAKVLQFLDISNNAFHGTLPERMCNEALTAMWLANNALTGTIPDTFDRCNHLAQIGFSFNSFDGTIPDSLLTNKPLLNSLYLDSNNLTGTIPPIIKSVHLTDISFSNNRFYGTIPEFSAELLNLFLSNNAFEGTLPKLPDSMTALLINNNNLNGTLDVLRDLTRLVQLDISHNEFSGDLSISESVATSLTVFNVSHNMLTTIDQVPNITQCDASFNRFKCPLPVGADLCKATCL